MRELTLGEARRLAERALAASQQKGVKRFVAVSPEEMECCFVNGAWHPDVIIEASKLGLYSQELAGLRIVGG